MFRSPRRPIRSLAPAVFLFLFPSILAAAPVPHVSPVRPLQTELVAPLDLSRLKVGGSVFLRVSLGWAESDCTLRTGSIIQGHILEILKRSKGVRDSRIEISFDAVDCDAHHEISFPFTLVALIAPPATSTTGQSGVGEAPPLADAIGNSIGGSGGGLRGATTASAINGNFSQPGQTLPAQVLPGQVLGLRKLALGVGTGPGGATVITGQGHDLRLEAGTGFILTHTPAAGPGNAKNTPAQPVTPRPEHNGFSMSGTGGGGSEMVSTGSGETHRTAAPAAPNPPPEPPDQTEICSGSCNVVVGARADTELHESAAVATLALKALGYSPRDNRELLAFDDDTTLTYLDADTLLCTFDPHHLRERAGSGQEAVRNVRAVLINARTHSIGRVMEWRVRGEDQYLWRLAKGQVLVHMGRELKLFDPQLQHLRSIPVEGKVAWVVSSPTGDHIAVGTVQERHSAAVHRDLETNLPGPPEEDVIVRVFDPAFRVILTTEQSSKAPVPVLSDEGELRVRGDGHTHWNITEYRWDRTEHTVASTRSACKPLLSAPGHDLIFAVGCTVSGGRWYRMLRPDGHALLKGESPSNEIQQFAEGGIDGAFAVRVIQTNLPMNYGQPFRKVDLAKERIAIYRSSDGSNLAAVTTADFALSQLGIALSPSGDQMALLGDSSIAFYTLHLARK